MRYLPIVVVLAFLGVKAAAGSEDVPYTVAGARWPATLGNHRAVVRVEQKADAVWAHLPWRRRDVAPAEKNVVIVDAATGSEIKNRALAEINREFGDVVFQPPTAPGNYYVYYLPFTENPVLWQYKTEYAKPQVTAEPAWLKRHALTADGLRAGQWRTLPAAKVLEFQTWSPFHRFDPMEVIATADETKGLVAKHAKRAYLLFPEDRKYPIRMTDDLPLCWIRRGPGDELRGEAQRGEFYVFQVGLYAARQAIEDLSVEISDLRPQQGSPIPASAFHAFNFSGTDWLGRPMTRRVRVPEGKVAPLWFGVQIPKEAAPGAYQATLTFRPKNADPSTVRLLLSVSPEVLEDGGVSDLWRHARLKWLDSTIGLDDEVVAPYTPLVVEGQTVRCLGRSVTFAETGLPGSITSGSHEILAAPMAMVVQTGEGPIVWTGGRVKLAQPAPGAVLCESQSSGGPVEMASQAKMEADGYLNYRLTLKASQAVDLKDIRLEIPFRREVAAYMMGLERKGGLRPAAWKWTWNVDRATNMVWIGDVEAGLHCKLKGPKDTWDIADLRAGGIPDSWGNHGRGGATVSEQGESVVFRAYSGPRSVKAGDELEFRFGLLITPVKPLNPSHWNQRYYHYYAPVVPVETIAKTGANIINCHQGNELNPYINYPFLTTGPMAAYVKDAHAKGMKVKTYYTVRELSNYVAEMWALRSLGDEIFLDGGGGGHSWLCEHLVSHYASAWHQPYPNGEVDAAIVTTGLSRWHNYYLEGLAYLVKNVGLDGLYLDGIGYDREIMKRVRKVMDRARPGCLIDFHSGNEFGFAGLRISPANKYMEHFPYIDSLWFGEGYDYHSEPPDYWLVEISGIPFGLYGEMLQGGGNPWRGMLYGMTNRLGWGGDPRPIWKLWDQFGIHEARMIGYWDAACPVKTGHKDILATAYVKRGKALIALASWAPEPVDCRLDLDWPQLGLESQKAHFYAPALEGIQMPALFKPADAIPVLPARGWMLIVDTEPHTVPAGTTADVYQGLDLLLEDQFDRPDLGEPWKRFLSSRGGASLKTGAGGLSIAALANCFAFVERPLPPGTRLVECSVFSGDDKGATWGTGMTLVWPNKALRINLRAEGRLGVDDGADFIFGGVSAPNSLYRLRIRLDDKQVCAEVSPGGKLWYPIHSYPRSRYPGEPIAVRLGKTGPGGRAEDYSEPGAAGRGVIRQLRVFGKRR